MRRVTRGILFPVVALFLFIACDGAKTKVPNDTDGMAGGDAATDDDLIGAGCAEGETRCAGELFLRCEGGSFTVTDCAASDAVCDPDEGCVPTDADAKNEGNDPSPDTDADAPDCPTHYYRQCDEGSSYWFDACGNREDPYEICTETQKCIKGECVEIDLTGPVFYGDTLIVINTATTGTPSAFTGELPYTPPPTPPLLPWEKRGIKTPRPDLTVPLPEGLDRSRILRGDRVTPRLAPVGTVETFAVYDFSNGGNRFTTATLQHVGTTCEVWTEETAAVSQERAALICAEFETAIYPLVTGNFYDAADINGDGRIALLLVDLAGHAGGYFTQADYYPKEDYEYSNARDMIYLEITLEDTEIFDAAAHELQHLCYSNRQVLIENDWSSTDLSNRWIDEGLATSAEYLYTGSHGTWVFVFNSAFYNEPVGLGNGFYLWDYGNNDRVASDYALAYAFFQYLRVQADQPDGIYRAIIEHADNDWRAVDAIIRDRVDASKGLSAFMTDFRIALLVNDPTGPYGFTNEPGLSFDPRRYSGTGMNLEGGGALYLPIDGSFTAPGTQGTVIQYVGVKTKAWTEEPPDTDEIPDLDTDTEQPDEDIDGDVLPYGTVSAAGTAFPHIYDGNGDINQQLQDDMSGLLMQTVFTGVFGAANKPIPGNGSMTTLALATHWAAQGGTPATVTVVQQSDNGTAIINPMIELLFPTDNILPTMYMMDPTDEGSVKLLLINAVGDSDSCVLAEAFSGITNVTAAYNTTAASGGSITFGVVNAKIYYPTETPVGDISGQFSDTTICPKE